MVVVAKRNGRDASLSVYLDAVTSLLSAADRLKRRLGALVEAESITLQQYNVLRILRGADAPGLPIMEVRNRMLERAPGITRLINRLESKELIARSQESDDRRRVTCRLTKRGETLLSRLDASVNRADRAAFERLSETELRKLSSLLTEVAR